MKMKYLNNMVAEKNPDIICEGLIAGIQEASANALLNGERLLRHLHATMVTS
jgi:hypothetical protein